MRDNKCCDFCGKILTDSDRDEDVCNDCLDCADDLPWCDLRWQNLFDWENEPNK